MDAVELSVERVLAGLEYDLATDPRRVFRASTRLAHDLLRSGQPQILGRVDDIRARSFARYHVRLPALFGSPLTLGVLTFSGYFVVYFGGASNLAYATYLHVISLLVGALLVLSFSHPFAHVFAARLCKMSVEGVYLGGRVGFEPTLLVSLVSYYHVQPKTRFWFHMAGPLSTIMSSLALSVEVWLVPYLLLLRLLVAALPFAVVAAELVNSSRKGDVARAKATLREGVLK
jgi:hypothetical protein